MPFKRSFLERMLMEQAGDEGGAGGSGAGGNEGDKNKGGTNDDGTGGQKSGDNQGSGSLDLSKLPQEVQDLVKGLRSESAKHRTEKNNLATELEKLKNGFKAVFGDEQDQDTPEVKLQNLSAVAQQLEMKNAMLELAYEHGIGKDQREFFEFQMSKALDSLADGEEMTEEQLQEIIAKVKPIGSKGNGNTSVDDKNAGKKDPAGQTGTTLEQFMAMSITQKSKLYSEKPDVYNALMSEAKTKKLI